MNQLDEWRYCPRCTTPLTHAPGSVSCAACGFVFYANPAPAVCALVLDDAGRVLLGRRARDPGAGLWDLLGGFMNEDEQPFDTLRREVREETGLEVEPMDFVGAVTDRYGEGGIATLNLAWTARILGGEPKAADDVAELAWLAPDELPADKEFAFPNSPALLRAWCSM